VFTTHRRPVFNPRTRTRRPIRPRTVRMISTEVSCSPCRRLSQMAPSVMAPMRSGSSLRALIASFPTGSGTHLGVISILSRCTQRTGKSIRSTGLTGLDPGLATQFADGEFIGVCKPECPDFRRSEHSALLRSRERPLGRAHDRSAPPTSCEDLATADTWWIVDADRPVLTLGHVRQTLPVADCGDVLALDVYIGGLRQNRR
jgi:hypothetical protein